jgi:oligopeptide transport system ATP-binding protein
MTEPLLRVAALRKVFGEHVAVDGVSFEVAEGGSLAIVGESGSGKTTIARMLVGLERPTEGTITFAGHDRTQPAKSNKDRKARSRRPRVDELAGLVGLDARQRRALPRALSGGQRQRVAIARVLAAEPLLIILDEAVAALDVSIQAQVLNLLTDIRDATGVSYILISHDLAVVRQLCERVIVMHRGVVVERGATAHVLDEPQHPYTRLLRDSVPGPGWKPRRRAAAASA